MVFASSVGYFESIILSNWKNSWKPVFELQESTELQKMQEKQLEFARWIDDFCPSNPQWNAQYFSQKHKSIFSWCFLDLVRWFPLTSIWHCCLANWIWVWTSLCAIEVALCLWNKWSPVLPALDVSLAKRCRMFRLHRAGTDDFNLWADLFWRVL